MACPTGLQAYVPAETIKQAAGLRFGSGDLVSFVESLPLDNIQSFDFVGQITSGGYLVGLAGPGAAILVLFLVLSLLLVFGGRMGGCCRGDSVLGLIFFLLFCAGSGAGWFISISANAQVEAGLRGILDGIDCAFAAADNTFASVDTVESVIENASASFGASAVTCAAAATLGGSAGFDGIPSLTNLTQSISPVFNQVDSIRSSVEGVKNQVNSIVAIIRQYLPLYNTFFYIFAIAVIAVIVVFAVTTSVGVMRVLGKEDCMREHRCLGTFVSLVRKTTAWVVFIVGYVLLLIFVALLFILSFVVILGVDVCVPSPTDTIQDLATIVAQKTGNIASNTTICDDPILGVLCHYQTCVGANPLVSTFDGLLGPLNNSVDQFNELVDVNLTVALTDINNLIETSETALAGANVISCSAAGDATCSPSCVPDDPTADSLCAANNSLTEALAAAENCLEDAQETSLVVNQLDAVVAAALATLECTAFTPVYQKVVEQEVCNNLFSGLALTFISLIVAVYALLCAMFIFRLMDLRPWEDQPEVEMAQKI